MAYTLKSENEQQVARLSGAMRRTLVLGKWESWFASHYVSFVHIQFPNCDGASITDMEDFANFLDDNWTGLDDSPTSILAIPDHTPEDTPVPASRVLHGPVD